jgi:hypothetical protein
VTLTQGKNVQEGKEVFVLGNFITWYFAVDDFREECHGVWSNGK